MTEAMTTDETYAALASEVGAAAARLVEVAEEQPDEWWHPYELRRRARNGWSPGAMGLALDKLIASGTFEVDHRQMVRLRH